MTTHSFDNEGYARCGVIDGDEGLEGAPVTCPECLREVNEAALREVRKLMRREEGPAAYLAGQRRYRPLPITF